MRKTEIASAVTASFMCNCRSCLQASDRASAARAARRAVSVSVRAGRRRPVSDRSAPAYRRRRPGPGHLPPSPSPSRARSPPAGLRVGPLGTERPSRRSAAGLPGRDLRLGARTWTGRRRGRSDLRSVRLSFSHTHTLTHPPPLPLALSLSRRTTRSAVARERGSPSPSGATGCCAKIHWTRCGAAEGCRSTRARASPVRRGHAGGAGWARAAAVPPGCFAAAVA